MEMRMKPTIITAEKWKVYTIVGFFCFFVFTLFISSNQQRSVGVALVSTNLKADTDASIINSTYSSSVAHAVDQTVDASSTTTTVITSSTNLVVESTYSSASNMTTSLPPVTARSEVRKTAPPPASTTSASTTLENVTAGEGERKKSCNIFEGRWVYKPTENPMYNADNCPFLAGEASCRRNGRPDSDYEGWIWEPSDCDIPLFNGKDMVEKMRGKRVIFVGDSLNRNQWLSLACLIYTSISPTSSFYKISEIYKVLKVQDYDFTLEFYWSPLLVELDYKRKILKLDKLDPASKQWRGADVMVFNSGHWWTHAPTMRAWDVIEYKGQLIEEIEKEEAYEKALSTWLTWLDNNVNPNKTTVFFRSISPEHKGKQWCFNETSPILDDSYINRYPQSMTNVIEKTINNYNVKGLDKMLVDDQIPITVKYLNITTLSGYRMDAHPSLYNKKDFYWNAALADFNKVAKQNADCSHWCLPGVPDTWNRLIYVSLFFSALNETQTSLL